MQHVIQWVRFFVSRNGATAQRRNVKAQVMGDIEARRGLQSCRLRFVCATRPV